MARVFISHSSRDNEPASRIKAWLTGQGFETPFLDYDKHTGIPPGVDWEKTLYREIALSEAMVIVQTPNWLDSKWCFAEFTQARALGKSIFPIIETSNSDIRISPDIQALDLSEDREGGLAQLSRQLTQIALDAQGGFTWDARRPPYPGLLAFQEEDAAIYFGRDDDIRRLIERLNARRTQGGSKLIALLGASGSGKSSLLRAGVIPRLKRAGRNWIVLPTMRPQVHPIDELARSLAVACGGDTDWRKLREEFEGGNFPLTLSDIASDLRIKAAANEAQILLPIDQAEELFVASDPNQAQRFLAILSIVLTSELPFLAVMAIRSDYLGSLQSAAGLEARFEEFSLGPMPPARIAQIIEGPAKVAGLGVDAAFVHQAAQDARTEDALPLLAFALRELYDRSSDNNYLSLGDYQALGDATERLTPLENAVRKAADDALVQSRPSAEEITALRAAFIPAMVGVNEQREYVRRSARWDELPSKSYFLLERLAKARLLIVSQVRNARTVEVAHEALLRKWPVLANWIDETKSELALLRTAEQDAYAWELAGRPASSLWPHERLQLLFMAMHRLQYVLPRENEPLCSFVRPEAERLIDELTLLSTSHLRRLAIGDRLAAIGDPRPGVGLQSDETPAIEWCEIPRLTQPQRLDQPYPFEIHSMETIESFFISRYPTTRDQYLAYLKAIADPSWERYYRDCFSSGNRPVDNVSVDNAWAYCRWLGGRVGVKVQLPSASQSIWATHSAKIGSSYPWGDQWEDGCSNTRESNVGRSTAVGLYPLGASEQQVMDLVGNVWEWTQTPASQENRFVLIGGSWYGSYPRNGKVAVTEARRDYKGSNIGFRPICARPT